jgi:hypothetical protein
MFRTEGELAGLVLVASATVYVVASLSPWPQPARTLVRSWHAARRVAQRARTREWGYL